MAVEEKLKTLKAIFPGNVWYKELNQDERNVVKDWREHIIFEIIYGMPLEIRKKIANSIQIKEEYSLPYIKEQEGWMSFFEECFCNSHGVDKEKFKRESSPEIQSLKDEEFKEFMNSDMINIFRIYNLARNPFEMGELYSCHERIIFQMQLDFHREKYGLDKTEI